jgi:hypothetical protein
MATVNAIALRIISEQGEANDDADFVAQVEAWVNDALSEIAIRTNYNSFKTRDTFNTVVATAEYQLPAGGRSVLQMRYTDNGQPIKLWTIQEAARRMSLLEEPGRARVWLEDGTITQGSNILYQFRLAPVPDSILEIEYEFYYHPSEIASASVLPVQDQFVGCVKHYVRAQFLERDQKYDAGDRAQRRYEVALENIVKIESNPPAQDRILKPSDLQRHRRGEAIFDPLHYNNGLGGS